MSAAQAAAEAARPIDPVRLRRALGGFPTGVTVVTARVGGRLVGMTANSFSSVSLDPPLVSWCVATAAASHPVFAQADAYAVHVLGADHRDMAMRFAGRAAGGPGDKFADIAHRPGRLGAPLIDGLAPVFECRVWARYPGGDHTILVGEVMHLVERVQDPLLFHSGTLHSGLLRPAAVARCHSAPAQDGFAKTYLAYLLARASHVVSGEFHEVLKGFGLSVPEWRVLACLSDAEGLSVVELARMAIMKQPRMTRILDRLVRDGLVERRADAADGRRALIHLTQAGRATAGPVLAAARAHEAELLSPLRDEDRATIKHGLDLLIGSKDQDGA